MHRKEIARIDQAFGELAAATQGGNPSPSSLKTLAAEYKGVYHCLLGHIAMLEGIGPEELTIEPLLKRASKGGIKEIILATNPDLEGEGTAVYLRDALADVAKAKGIRLTRIARGVPAGAEIENVSSAILSDSLSGRQAFEGGK